MGAYANADRAAELLGWRTSLSIEDAIASALAWGEKRQEILGYATIAPGSPLAVAHPDA